MKERTFTRGQITYKVIAAKRKTIGITVNDGEVVVRAPSYVSAAEIDKFVGKESAWIERAIERQKRRNSLGDELERENCVLVFGERVALPEEVLRSADRRKAILRFYGDAIKEVGRRAAFLSAKTGLQYASCRFSNAETLWGVCDASGKIRLNWRLAALPRPLCDYVIVHELCHTLHHNHSAAFWAEMARLMPDCKQRRNALKEYSWLLKRYR